MLGFLQNAVGRFADYEATTYDYYTTTSDPETTGAVAAILVIYILFVLAIGAVGIIANWKIFTKAGQPGWASIVPFYNIYIMLKIIGRPGWWLLLLLIPFVNIVVALFVSLDLAKSFGKSTAFGVVGLFLFSIIGYVMLAFGSAKYVGPKQAI